MSYLQKYRIKFIALATLSMAIITSACGFVVYTTASNTVEWQLAVTAKSLAVAVAQLVDSDAGEYRELVKNPDPESEYYKRMTDSLRELKITSGAMFIYTMSMYDEDEGIYILDAEPMESNHYTRPGTKGKLGDALVRAVKEKAPIGSELTEVPPYGSMLTGAAPIVDKATGEGLGVACVDVSVKQHVRILGYQRNTIIAVVLVATAAVFMFAFFVSDNFSRPMMTDSLTRAYNKRFFERSLKVILDQARRSGEPVHVFMIDLDHFKSVNDKYGHLFGDRVLKAVSSAIAELLRKHDLFARYGGEEFVAVLPGSSTYAAMAAAERIRAKAESISINEEATGDDVTVTVSVGIAEYTGQTPHQLIESADKALYKAKGQRNSVRLYSEQM